MAYKFSIGNVVEVPFKFSVSDAGKVSNQSMVLVCDRLSPEELTESLQRSDLSIEDFLLKVTTGWKNQRFLLDDDGQPAEFSADALSALLSFPGLATPLLTAYLKEQGAKEKN